MKDYITITKEDNTKEEMEVVFECESREFNKKYIIYKSLVTNQFYAASYSGTLDDCKLDSNLLSEEKAFLERVFDEVRRDINA